MRDTRGGGLSPGHDCLRKGRGFDGISMEARGGNEERKRGRRTVKRGEGKLIRRGGEKWVIGRTNRVIFKRGQNEKREESTYAV